MMSANALSVDALVVAKQKPSAALQQPKLIKFHINVNGSYACSVLG